MGMLLLMMIAFFALAAACLGYVLGAAFGAWRRSLPLLVIGGTIGGVLGLALGVYHGCMGLGGDASGGFTWYGGDMCLPIWLGIVMMLVASMVTPVVAFLIARGTKPDSNMTDPPREA